jgi:hypothetical protein
MPFVDLHHLPRPKKPRRRDLVLPLDHSDHIDARQLRRVHKHQPDRPRAKHDHRVARPRRVSSSPRTTQASGSVSAACSNATPSGMCNVFFSTIRAGTRMYSAYAPLLKSRSSHRFCWPRVQKKARIARRGVQRHNAVALLKPLTPRLPPPRSGQFMAEWDRGLQHHGVISAPVNLQVSSASQRRPNPDYNLSRLRHRHRNSLHAEVFLSVKHGRKHLIEGSFILTIFSPMRHSVGLQFHSRKMTVPAVSLGPKPASDKVSHLCPLSRQTSLSKNRSPPSRNIPS